jgi:hypothetical protein
VKNLKNQMIENGIESVKTKARVYDIGYIEAYRMWLKETVAGPAVRAAVKDAVDVKPLDNYYTTATYNTEDIY